MTSTANIVSSGRPMLQGFSSRKTSSSYQVIKVNALFGGKKDSGEKGDGTPSKVSHLEHCESKTINRYYFSYIPGSLS